MGQQIFVFLKQNRRKSVSVFQRADSFVSDGIADWRRGVQHLLCNTLELDELGID